jgi:hypothetical protein
MQSFPTTDQELYLQDLLSTHADVLRPLLDGLWPIQPWKVEQFGPLTKYTLGQMEDKRWAMLHRLCRPDSGKPHDHPCQMESHRIKGSYWERIYTNGGVQDVLREAGSSHVIEPDCVHLITELPEGEAWTLCFTGPVVRQWRHYPEMV